MLLLLLKGQLHGPDAQGPHVGQGAEHTLLAVSLWGLESQAQAFPYGSVTAFSCPETFPGQALWGEVEATRDSCFSAQLPKLSR